MLGDKRHCGLRLLTVGLVFDQLTDAAKTITPVMALMFSGVQSSS